MHQSILFRGDLYLLYRKVKTKSIRQGVGGVSRRYAYLVSIYSRRGSSFGHRVYRLLIVVDGVQGFIGSCGFTYTIHRIVGSKV